MKRTEKIPSIIFDDDLMANLGTNGLLRGFHVHFQRSVTKCAYKDSSDENSKYCSKKIAWKISELANREDVLLAFNILCGKTTLHESKAAKIFKESVQLNQQQIDQVNSSDWGKAEDWCKWWARPKVVKMFTKVFTEMTLIGNFSFADNKCSGSTKQAVASKSTSAIVKLDNWHREDKKHSYQ